MNPFSLLRAGLLILAASALLPAAAMADDAEAAWKEIKALCNPALIPTPPKEWKKEPPNAAAFATWRNAELQELHAIRKSAQEFYTRYPEHAHASSAHILEKVATALTLNLEATEPQSPAGALNAQEVRYLHYSGVHLRKARTTDALSIIALRLEKQYPGQQSVYSLLLAAAADSSPERAHQLAGRIIASEHASDDQKSQARRFLIEENEEKPAPEEIPADEETTSEQEE